MINLTEWLFENTKNKKKTSLSIGQDKISYAELYSLVCGLTNKLRNSVGQDKNILLVSDNSVFFVISYLAIIGSGNVCIPLKFDKNLNFELIKKRTDSEILFIQKKYLDDLMKKGFSRTFTEESIKEDTGVDFKFQKFSKNKIAVINFTSGTSGEPKGVMITQNNILKNTESIISSLYLTEKDKALLILPFSYCFGASILHTHFRVGAEIKIFEGIFLPQKILDELVSSKCTVFAGVPTTFQLLFKKTKINEMSFPDMRCIQQAGGKLSEDYIKRLIDVFGREKIFIMYGQTEATARLSILDPKFLPNKIGSVGRGLNEVSLDIQDSEGNSLKPNQEGEIVAEGENIMLGYYKDPEETKKKIINGFLKTGDLGMKDVEGFIYITGRIGDFIKSRGHRVSKNYLEDKIREIPGILEIGVIGLPDEILGEKIVVFLSREETLNKEEIFKFCQKNLKSYEVPKEIIFLKELPKNSSSKIDYARLKREYSFVNQDDKPLHK